LLLQRPNSAGRDAATIASIHTGDENSGSCLSVFETVEIFSKRIVPSRSIFEMTLEKAVREPVSTPIAVEKLLGEEIRRADRERLIVLLLNSKYCLVKKEIST